MTDGPFAETKDLIAGFMIIDVASYQRAVELAGELSAAPGAGATDPRVAGGAAVHGRSDEHHRVMGAATSVDEAQLRDLIPGVLAALVHRGADFATAEDAVQEALVRAVETWPDQRPDDPKGWLITTAWRRFIDLDPTAPRGAAASSVSTSPRRVRPCPWMTRCSSTFSARTRA